MTHNTTEVAILKKGVLPLIVSVASINSILLLSGLISWFLALAATVMCVVASIGLASWWSFAYDLQRRIERPVHMQWSIHVNGILVGSVCDAEYARIVRGALSSKRLAVHQAYLVGESVLKSMAWAMFVAPAVLAWIVLLAGDVNADLMMLFKEFSTGGDTIYGLSRVLILLAIALFGMKLTSSLLPGRTRNVYRESIHDALRTRCDCPAPGQVTLSHGTEALEIER